MSIPDTLICSHHSKCLLTLLARICNGLFQAHTTVLPLLYHEYPLSSITSCKLGKLSDMQLQEGCTQPQQQQQWNQPARNDKEFIQESHCHIVLAYDTASLLLQWSWKQEAEVTWKSSGSIRRRKISKNYHILETFFQNFFRSHIISNDISQPILLMWVKIHSSWI